MSASTTPTSLITAPRWGSARSFAGPAVQVASADARVRPSSRHRDQGLSGWRCETQGQGRAPIPSRAGFRGYFTNAGEMVANIAQASRPRNSVRPMMPGGSAAQGVGSKDLDTFCRIPASISSQSPPNCRGEWRSRTVAGGQCRPGQTSCELLYQVISPGREPIYRAPPAGFEPATCGLGNRCSIP